MVSQNRASRIAKGIQEMLSEMLLFEVTDPRLKGVFVTDVNVDRELAFATVYVSALEGAERRGEILDGFHSAAGFLRSQLAQRSDLRTFPRLRFIWDQTPEHAEKIEKLLADIHEEEKKGKQGG